MKKLLYLTDHKNINLVPDEKGIVDLFLQYNIKVDIRVWDKVDWNSYKNILIRTPWDYSDKRELFLEKVNNLKNSNLIHSSEIINWNLDKDYLVELMDKKLNIVPTISLKHFDPNQVQSYLDQYGTIVLKPKVGAGGKNTFKLSSPSSEIEILRGTDVLLQPYFSAITEEGEYSFIFFAGQFSHAVLKTPKIGEFRVQDDHGGHVVAYKPTPSEVIEAKHFLDSIDFDTLYARVDLVRKDNMFYLMELELIEPELFFRFSDKGMERFVALIASVIM